MKAGHPRKLGGVIQSESEGLKLSAPGTDRDQVLALPSGRKGPDLPSSDSQIIESCSSQHWGRQPCFTESPSICMLISPGDTLGDTPRVFSGISDLMIQATDC